MKWSKIVAALACIWPIAASAMSSATPEQMVCVPAVFIVATVTEDTPLVDLAESCEDEPSMSCVVRWPLKVKVEQLLAARPSRSSVKDISSVQAGSILQLTVKTWVLRKTQSVAPGDGQGEMLAAYLPKAEMAKAVRRRKFIFGVYDYDDGTSQIWSISFRERLEKALTEAAGAARQDQPGCARLIK